VEEIDLAKRMVSGRNLDSGEPFADRYDRLVLATGAHAIRPRVDGLNLENIFSLHSVFDADALLRAAPAPQIQDVAIVGGGISGWNWRGPHPNGQEGNDRRSGAANPDFVRRRFRRILRQYLEKKGVRILTAEGLKAIRGQNGKVTHVLTQTQDLKADAVVLSLGVRPRVDLAQKRVEDWRNGSHLGKRKDGNQRRRSLCGRRLHRDDSSCNREKSLGALGLHGDKQRQSGGDKCLRWKRGFSGSIGHSHLQNL